MPATSVYGRQERSYICMYLLALRRLWWLYLLAVRRRMRLRRVALSARLFTRFVDSVNDEQERAV